MLRQRGLDLPPGVAHAEDLRAFRNAQQPRDEWADIWAQRSRRHAEQWERVVAPRRHAPPINGTLHSLTEDGEAVVDAAVARALERMEYEHLIVGPEFHAKISDIVAKVHE